jgi:hypothetical protein
MSRQQLHSHCSTSLAIHEGRLLSAARWHVARPLSDVTSMLQVTTVTRAKLKRCCLTAVATSTDRLCSCLPSNEADPGDILALGHSNPWAVQASVTTAPTRCK